jgi:hypothetical protein
MMGMWLLTVGMVASAQSQCTAIMQEAIRLVGTSCAATARNEACHGYFRVEAKLTQPDPTFTFGVGDIIAIEDLRALTTAPLNEALNEWGVALLRLQVNLPDALPGQNVTFLVLGDTRISDQGGASPMQAFRLETGVRGISCAEAPSDGLVIQSPQGNQLVKMTVNGIEIETSGTAFVQAVAGESMTITALEGMVQVTVGDEVQTVLPGTAIDIPMSEALVPVGSASEARAISLADVPPLPSALLPRDVTIANPAFPLLLTGDVAIRPPALPPDQGMPLALATSIALGTPVADLAASAGGVDVPLLATSIALGTPAADLAASGSNADVPPLATRIALGTSVASPTPTPEGALSVEAIAEAIGQQSLLISLALLAVLVLLVVGVLVGRRLWAAIRQRLD